MMSVKEIKARLDKLGVSYEGVLEKQELFHLLESSGSQTQSRSASSLSANVVEISMSVSDLREIIRSLAGRTHLCSEKMDLYLMARDLLRDNRCEICLENNLLTSPSETVVKAPCCLTFFHQSCWSQWILKSVQQGIYPHKCPACKSQIQDKFVENRILTHCDPKYLPYVSALENLKALRQQESRRERANDEENDKSLRSAGFRKCPKCGSWIEKGPSLEAFGIALAAGCDKMTCRCGCKFCYNCGSLGAQCDCTGPEHGFFDHREVLADYPRNNFRNLL